MGGGGANRPTPWCPLAFTALLPPAHRAGQLLVGLADARRWHFGITVVTYLITLASRGGMALLHGFAAHLLLILASEACQSPFSIITDAAIAAATNEAGYTRKRVLASLGWGGGWTAGMAGRSRGAWGSAT